MATKYVPILQPRDRYLLWGLYLSPMTIKQGMEWSLTGRRHFSQEIKVYNRLEQFRTPSVGWVRRWQYAIASRGPSPYYYKLTRKGYRALMQNDQSMPTGKYSFAKVSRNEEFHTQGLSNFIIATFAAARRNGFVITDCAPDMTVALAEEDERPLYPDFLFTLVAPNREQFHFCVEFDRHTLPVRSDSNRDALIWKMRRYISYHYAAARAGHNFRVLFPTIGKQVHVENIIDAAREVILEPRREIFYACQVQDYLSVKNPLFTRVWQSQKGSRAALIPKYHREARRPQRIAAGLLDETFTIA